MAQFINKNEVENILRNLWKKDDGHNSEHRICYNKALEEVQCELDTLEVKEVDLNREIEKEIETRWRGEYLFTSKFRESAKYFFELGLSVNNPITASDRGIVDEIIFALNALGKEKMISYDKEIEWLRNKVQGES